MSLLLVGQWACTARQRQSASFRYRRLRNSSLVIQSRRLLGRIFSILRPATSGLSRVRRGCLWSANPVGNFYAARPTDNGALTFGADSAASGKITIRGTGQDAGTYQSQDCGQAGHRDRNGGHDPQKTQVVAPSVLRQKPTSLPAREDVCVNWVDGNHVEWLIGQTIRTRLGTLDNLAGLLASEEDDAGAEALYRRALATAEKALGPDHPTTCEIRENLDALRQKGAKWAGLVYGDHCACSSRADGVAIGGHVENCADLYRDRSCRTAGGNLERSDCNRAVSDRIVIDAVDHADRRARG